MPTADQAIQNKPLNGHELKLVCLRHVRELLVNTEIDLIAAIEDRMSRDQLFAPSPYTHPRCRVEIQFRFHWSNKNLPKTEFQIAVGQTEQQAEDVIEFVSGTNRELTIESPNLERLATGIPFTQIEAVKPKPGEMFGSFTEKEIPVNPEEYPKPNPPKDEDVTEFVAADLKVPEHKRIRGKKKSRGGPKG